MAKKDLTYIDAMNRLMEMAPIVGLSANQAWLMQCLLHGWNRLGRPEQWNQATANLCHIGCVTRDTFTKIRNVLKQHGFVEFDKGTRKKSASYKLGRRFCVSFSDVNTDTNTDISGDINSDTNADTLTEKRRAEEREVAQAPPPPRFSMGGNDPPTTDEMESDRLAAGGDWIAAFAARIGMDKPDLIAAAESQGIQQDVFTAWATDRAAALWRTPSRHALGPMNWLADLSSFSRKWERFESGDRVNGSAPPATENPKWLPANWREIARDVTGEDCSDLRSWREVPMDRRGDFERACRETGTTEVNHG